MKERRGTTVLAADLERQLALFSPGDIVTSVMTGNLDFLGTVERVDGKACKVLVNWGDGLNVQHGPDEIQLMPYVEQSVRDKMKSLVSRRGKLASGSMAEAVNDPQFVGNPGVHGLGEPRGGGFSIMQDLQKDLSKESAGEAKDNPKVSPVQASELRSRRGLRTGRAQAESCPFAQVAEAGASRRDAAYLDVPQKHQRNIALQTLKMNDVFARIMGGMTKEEARAFLKSIGYSDARIRRLEASERTAAAVTKADWEKALKEDKAMLAKYEKDLATLKKGGTVENLSIEGAEGSIEGLKAVISNKEKLIRNLRASEKTALSRREVITIDETSEKSIRDAERKKAKLENAGYTLVRETGGFFRSTLVYEMRASVDRGFAAAVDGDIYRQIKELTKKLADGQWSDVDEAVKEMAWDFGERNQVGAGGADPDVVNRYYRAFMDEFEKGLRERKGKKVASRDFVAAAGPHTLMVQLQEDFRQGKLDDDEVLKSWGFAMGHTKGADYIVGAGQDIVWDLLGFDSGRKDADAARRTIQQNIRQAVKDNEIFKGLRGEERETHDRWMEYSQDCRKAASEGSIRSRRAELEDSAEDIAVDVVSRIQEKRMTMQQAFRQIGYGDLYGKTRQTDLPDDFNELPTDKKVKALEKAVSKAQRRASIASLRSRRAMYWMDKGRVYRLTQQEQEKDCAICPKCRAKMKREPFTRSEKLWACPKCGFKVPTGSTVTERRVEVEVEPDGTVGVGVQGSRRGRMAKDEPLPTWVDPAAMTRFTLSDIAHVIYDDHRQQGRQVGYAAKPYLEAMSSLRDINDDYMNESGRSVVVYLLGNLSGWRGETAKAVKKELQRRLKTAK